jgi:uncharacterized MnhB-related membrane protein
MTEYLHLFVLLVLIISAFYAVWFRDLLSSVLALAAFSLVMSLEFYILQAPDVAIAEAAIGAGLSTAIFLMALRACGRLRKGNGGGMQ